MSPEALVFYGVSLRSDDTSNSNDAACLQDHLGVTQVGFPESAAQVVLPASGRLKVLLNFFDWFPVANSTRLHLFVCN